MSAPLEAENDKFEPSTLGTKAFWDETYEKELSLFLYAGIEGDSWYGEESMKRVLRWIKSSPMVTMESSVLDIGCGNGAMLVKLYKEGYHNVAGVDYSENAIEMARCVAAKEKMVIAYEVADILNDKDFMSHVLSSTYNVCLDKGTYDTISLHSEQAAEKRNLYIDCVRKLLADGGLFIITSGNWTKNELTEHLQKRFVLMEQLPSPVLQFGGRTGNRETTLVFQKMSSMPSSRRTKICPTPL